MNCSGPHLIWESDPIGKNLCGHKLTLGEHELILVIDSLTDGLKIFESTQSSYLDNFVYCSAHTVCPERPPVSLNRIVQSDNSIMDFPWDGAVMRGSAAFTSLSSKSSSGMPLLNNGSRTYRLSQMYSYTEKAFRAASRSNPSGISPPDWQCYGEFAKGRPPASAGYRLPSTEFCAGFGCDMYTETRVDGFNKATLPTKQLPAYYAPLTLIRRATPISSAPASPMNEVESIEILENFVSRPVIRQLQAEKEKVPALEWPDGYLGLSGYACRFSYYQWLREKLKADTLIFDWSRADCGRLILTSQCSETDGSVIWSETGMGNILPETYGLFDFPLYLPNLILNETVMVNLLGRTSSHWTTLLDMKNPCLRLPPFLLLRLVRHLENYLETCPADFFRFAKSEQEWHDLVSDSIMRDTDNFTLCTLKREFRPTDRLSFRLHDEFVDAGSAKVPNPHVIPPSLEVPFRDLVIDDRFLCISIASQRDVTDSKLYDTMSPYIMMGQLALRGFQVVLDYHRNSIGFVQQQTFPAPQISTVPTRHCGGDKIYVVEDNRCVSPDCSSFLGLVAGAKGNHLCVLDPMFSRLVTTGICTAAFLGVFMVLLKHILLRHLVP